MADHESQIQQETDSTGQPQATSFSGAKKGNRRATTDGETNTMSSVPSHVPSCDPTPGSSSAASASMSSTASASMSSTASASMSSAASTSMSSAAAPRVIPPRFPVRVGITWRKGEKLEAMDFSHTWYPAKIVEIDEVAKYVLIHFEGWNQRYDEWVSMDSEKLRPVTRHSDRKDKGNKKRRIHPHPIYRAGEKVLAKWTDCKKYPAKVSRLMEDGMYEVIFYDGVTRHIQPINIQPMPESMKDLKTVPVPAPSAPKAKLSFKQIKVSLPDSVRRVKDRLDKGVTSSGKTVSDKTVSHKTVSDKNKVPERIKELVDKGRPLDAIPSCGVVLDRIRLSSRGRILTKKKFQPKKSPSSSRRGRPVGSLGRTNKKLPFPWRIPVFKRLPVQAESTVVAQAETTQLAGSALDTTRTAATTDPSPVSSATTPPTETAGKKPSLVTEADHADLSWSETTTRPEGTDQASTYAPPSNTAVEPQLVVSKRTKKRSHTVPHLHARRKKMRSKSKDDGAKSGGLVKRLPKLSQLDRAKSLDTATSTANPPATIPLPVPVFVPSKAFIVEEDHNPFKCARQGCNKAFRKENLLAYHIKYYHTQTETSLGCDTAAGITSPSLQSPVATPGIRRRRKKTSSICSTDSDVSISSKGKSSCKRYRDSDFYSLAAATSPDVLGRDLWTDAKHAHAAHDSAMEELVAVDTEDEDMEADVVNCVCGLRETSGLMIQCDVCMCWQHFVCVDSDNSGVPPANYVCRLCESTPGIRDSCRYMYDMGWERRGELPTFPFASDSSVEHLKSLACECNEMISAILAIKAALHCTRRQLKISKEEADPEFQLWQTDWDNWIKPEEDLTLTPRSGDPEPSPTPSTFLFSTAPRPDISSATTEVCSPSISVSSSNPLLQSSLSMLHVTATTIEISSVLESPPIISCSGVSTSAVTPPAGNSHTDILSPAGLNTVSLVPPLTPSVGHRISLPSFQGQASNLARDLFPGCYGDNSQPPSASRTQAMENHTDSSVQTQDPDLHPPVGEKMATSDNTLFLQSNSQQFSGAPMPGVQLGSVGPLSAGTAVCNGICSDLKTNAPNTKAETVSSSAPVALGQDAEERHGQLSLSLLVGGERHDQLSSASLGARLDRTPETYDSKHMSSLYVDHQVDGHGDGDDDDDVPDNDTDTAEESLDPYRNCEQNLLIHVSRVHSDIEKQLELLEQQITDLETSEHSNPTVHLTEDNVLHDVPALKKSLGKLHRNLASVERLCAHH
ncbi:hypothetical protein BsWGS_23958 [Bradybaena similaris]